MNAFTDMQRRMRYSQRIMRLHADTNMFTRGDELAHKDKLVYSQTNLLTRGDKLVYSQRQTCLLTETNLFIHKDELVYSWRQY